MVLEIAAAASVLSALLTDSGEPSDEERAITVWRVENDEGFGPHTEGVMGNFDDDPDFELLLAEIDLLNPRRDFSEEIVARLLESRHGEMLFGFSTAADAERWFGPFMHALRRDGFQIRPRRAKKVWPSRSGRQILFVPTDPRP